MLKLDVARRQYFRARGMLDTLYVYREYFSDSQWFANKESLERELKALRKRLAAYDKEIKRRNSA